MKISDFFTGQPVTQKDPDDGSQAYGHVTEIGENHVFIKWDDIKEPTKHDQELDLASIQPGFKHPSRHQI